MSVPNNESAQKQKLIIFILIFLSVLLLTLVAYLFYANNEKSNTIAFYETQLSETIIEKDSISIALENQMNELIQLQEKYTSLNEENTNIKLLIDELNRDKLEWQNRANLNKKQIAALQIKLSKAMVEYDAKKLEMQNEIAELKQVANILNEKNKNLSFSNDSLQAASQDQLLVNKGILKKASKLKAENLRMEIKGKNDKVITKAPYKESTIVSISTIFNIGKNDLAELGNKKIIMRIEKPDGGILYDASSNGNTFKTEAGNEIFYTVSKEINFKNKYDEVTLSYSKQVDMSDGLYNVGIYLDGYEIGRTSFEVR